MVEAAQSEKVNGLKKVWTDTVGQVQTRIKDVESAIKHQVEDLQARIKGAGEDGKKHFDTLKGQLHIDKMEEWIAQFRVKERAHDLTEKAQDLVDEGFKVTEETIEKLGIAQVADVKAVKEHLDKLLKRFENLRKRVSDMVTKKDFSKLVDRVDELEKRLNG